MRTAVAWLALSTLLHGVVASQHTSPRQESTFDNPVIYSDYPDNDVFLGPDGAYYFSASNFHYSPGAPILRSHDLVNWEPVGHSVPRLDFGTGYDLPATGERAYRGGTWASTMRYRESNGLWYWIGCTNFWNTWVFTAQDAEGPWSRAAYLGGEKCFYDCGLLIDDDDTMYVVHSSTQVKLSQLSADGLSEVRVENLLHASDVGADSIEGNRMYKINGTYYVLNDVPGSSTYVWKADNPWGPYEPRLLGENVASPVQGGGAPHQGSLIQTPDGDWYFMSFTWAFPAGRLPVLAPIVWGEDGFPSLVRGDNGGWGSSYPLPLPEAPAADWTGTDTFETLGPTWEWNHNPNVDNFEVDNGVILHTSTVTEDLYSAQNTLTHRTDGEFPVGTVEIDFANAADGDRFGLAAFRDRSAYIGIHVNGAELEITTKFNMTIDEYEGTTIDMGYVSATAPLPEGSPSKIWLRVEMDVRPNGSKQATFSYSLDGDDFSALGDGYELYTNWPFFLGYRHAIFNFATKALGGSIKVLSFTSA
jgi:beta-xylosidase